MAVPTASAALRFHNLFDTLMAAAMVVVAIVFLVFMEVRTGTGRIGSYALSGRIADAAGLEVGTDVRLGGVKVGRITAITVDPASYQAVIAMSIRDDLLLPRDSRLAITAPVMGDMYLSIQLGHDAKRIAQGGSFAAPPVKARPKPAPSS